jgi:hypothetical protein
LIINAFGPLLKSGAKRFLDGGYGTFILICLATFSKGCPPAGPKEARPKCDSPACMTSLIAKREEPCNSLTRFLKKHLLDLKRNMGWGRSNAQDVRFRKSMGISVNIAILI